MTEIKFPEAELLEKCGKLHTDFTFVIDVANACMNCHENTNIYTSHGYTLNRSMQILILRCFLDLVVK